MYDPTIGRFLTEDPIGFDGNDPNLYRYAGNDPINFRDPTGLTQAGNPLNNLLSSPSLSLAGNINVHASVLTPSQTSPLNSSFVTAFGSEPAVSSNSFQLRHVDNFPASVRSTFTDAGGRTRTIVDAGLRTFVFDPQSGFETGEQLNTIRGGSGGSFQVFASPGIAEKLVILENRSTAQLAGDAALTLTGMNLLRVARTAGVGAAATQATREVAEEFVQYTVQEATGLPIPVGIPSRGGGNPAPSRGSQWVDGGQSNYIPGRYSQPASNPGAYQASGKRVFPTLRNSRLRSPQLRAEQQAFTERRLREGADVAEIRGQAQQAGLERRGGINQVGGPDRLADQGAENAVQSAIQSVLGVSSK